MRAAAKEVIARHRGQPIAIGNEGISARFDGPARAVRCALALREAVDALGLSVAAGVHVGEISVHEGSVAGVALHVTERIASLAGPGEVLVSAIVNDLAAGSGLHFVERGSQRIEGVEGPVRLLSVMIEQHLEPAPRTAKTPSLDVLSSREREVLDLVAERAQQCGDRAASAAERSHRQAPRRQHPAQARSSHARRGRRAHRPPSTRLRPVIAGPIGPSRRWAVRAKRACGKAANNSSSHWARTN